MRLFINVPVTCRKCKSKFNLRVNKDKYNRWKNGEGLIQNMLPELKPEERELLLSGLCNDCWEEMCVEFDSFKDVYN